MFGPAQMQGVIGVAKFRFRLHGWIEHGFVPWAKRCGRGIRPQYTLGNLLYLKFTLALVNAHAPLAEASRVAGYLFPTAWKLLPAEISDVLAHSSDQADLAPRLFCVCRAGQPPVLQTSGAQMHEGFVIDVTRLVVETVSKANAVLHTRPPVAWEDWLIHAVVSDGERTDAAW